MAPARPSTRRESPVTNIVRLAPAGPQPSDRTAHPRHVAAWAIATAVCSACQVEPGVPCHLAGVPFPDGHAHPERVKEARRSSEAHEGAVDALWARLASEETPDGTFGGSRADRGPSRGHRGGQPDPVAPEQAAANYAALAEAIGCRLPRRRRPRASGASARPGASN